MQIKLLTNVANANYAGNSGDIIEVTSTDGNVLINAGCAVLVAEESGLDSNIATDLANEAAGVDVLLIE